MDKERQHRNLFAQCQGSDSIFDPIQARTLVLPGARVRKIRGGTEFPTNIKDNEVVSHGKMVDIFKCHTSHPIFLATEPLSLGQLRKGGGNFHFQGTFDNNKILIKSMLATNLLCIYNNFCQWYDTENDVFTPRTAEDEEQIDREPEHLTLITQKTAEHATSSRRLVVTTHRESRDADSESLRTGIIC